MAEDAAPQKACQSPGGKTDKIQNEHGYDGHRDTQGDEADRLDQTVCFLEQVAGHDDLNQNPTFY